MVKCSVFFPVGTEFLNIYTSFGLNVQENRSKITTYVYEWKIFNILSEPRQQKVNM
jgi:hypothetical protein